MAKSSAVSIVEGRPKKHMIRIDIPDELIQMLRKQLLMLSLILEFRNLLNC